MREINIIIDDFKRISCNTSKLGNKWDNGVSKLIFAIPEALTSTYRYLYATNSNASTAYLRPLDANNELIVYTGLTSIPGEWDILYFGTETEINPETGDIDYSKVVIVSDIIKLYIDDNDLTNPIPNEGLDPILQNMYDTLLTTNKYLLSDEFRSLCRGYSAYEIAVKNGFVGTEAKWLESLKGAKGETGETGDAGKAGDAGEAGYTPVRGVDYWTSDDIATIQAYINSKIGPAIELSQQILNGEVD